MVRFAPQSVVLRRLMDVAAGAAVGALVTLAFVDRTPEAAPPQTVAAAPVLSPRAFEARALEIVDGDTFEARIASFPGQEVVARIRVAGVDTPERRGRCEAESVAADASTEALRRLLDGKRLALTDVRGDKYFGRVVARVSAAGVGDVAAALVASGHGRAYEGGKRGGWCG